MHPTVLLQAAKPLSTSALTSSKGLILGSAGPLLWLPFQLIVRVISWFFFTLGFPLSLSWLFSVFRGLFVTFGRLVRLFHWFLDRHVGVSWLRLLIIGFVVR